jgi:hypothetical protein
MKDYEDYLGDGSWTFDIWTGLGQNEFATVTAHFFNKDWLLRRVTLELFHFPVSHTGENITSKLRETAEKWRAFPVQMTTDKGANVRLGVRTFLGKDGTLILAPFVPD